MEIQLSDTITNDLNKIPLSVDDNGNLYFTHNDITSQVNIDNKNNIYLDADDYTILTKLNIPQNKFKVHEMEETEEDENNDDDDYFPEDANIEEINNDQSEELDMSEQEEYFMIYYKKNPIDVWSRRNGDILSLYETYVYDDDLLFKTKHVNATPSYRLFVYKNGQIEFRPTGYPSKKYKLDISNNILKLINSA